MNAILARDKNNLIGSGGSLPWKDDPSARWDMESFKHLTSGNIVFMGYRTFLGFKSPLPGRINVVETKNPAERLARQELASSDGTAASSFIFASSLQNFLESYKNELETIWRGKKIFIIGGAATIAKYADKISCLYLTTFSKTYKGDVFLPKDFQEILARRFTLCQTAEAHSNGKIEIYKSLA